MGKKNKTKTKVKNKTKTKNKTKPFVKLISDNLDVVENQQVIEQKKEWYNLLFLDKWNSDPFPIESQQFPVNYLINYNDRNNHKFDLQETKKGIMPIYDLRKAAECHRQVRRHLQEKIQPGMSFMEIANTVENKIVELFGKNDKTAGIGFPTGISVNHIAAHDSANPNDTRILNYNDVCKIDYGTHVNGNIIDCAFTVAFNPKFEPLVNSTKDATRSAIKMAGPDVRLFELSELIKETIESYEIELDSKMIPIKAVTNLGGHNIETNKIHSGKLILCVPDGMDERDIMNEGECFAIETFATTGEGPLNVDYSMACNHYMKNFDAPRVNLTSNHSKKLLNYINRNRGTLPFCTRWTNEELGGAYRIGLNELVRNNIVIPYPPLVDKPGTYTSQMEHTLYLHENGVEVLSVGDDY